MKNFIRSLFWHTINDGDFNLIPEITYWRKYVRVI